MHEVLIKILDLVIRVRKWFGEQGKDILRWLISVALRALAWLERDVPPETPTGNKAQVPTEGSDARRKTSGAEQKDAKAATVPTPAGNEVAQRISQEGVSTGTSPAIEPLAIKPPFQPDDHDTSDETVLARLMASEGRTYSDKLIIGWSAMQTASARGKPLFRLLTHGLGYGPKDRRGPQGIGVLYASTDAIPANDDRALARDLLSGAVRPSAAIRLRKARRWIERGEGISDEQILMLQRQWNEGIYGRIAGTDYFLFGHGERKLGGKRGANSKKLLDEVLEVPALDAEPIRSAA